MLEQVDQVLSAIPREFWRLTVHSLDHLTSSVGTFPYTADQCREFIDVIRDPVTRSEDALTDIYVICVVGERSRNL